jgi:hypothetical protein
VPRLRRKHITDARGNRLPSFNATAPYIGTPLHGLKLVHTVKIGDGGEWIYWMFGMLFTKLYPVAITKILQRGSRVVVASATAGGEPDERWQQNGLSHSRRFFKPL